MEGLKGICLHRMSLQSGDGVAALAMAGNGKEMASCPPSSVIAMERSSRQKQSPIRLGDGFAAVTMTGAGQERLHQRALKVIS